MQKLRRPPALRARTEGSVRFLRRAAAADDGKHCRYRGNRRTATELRAPFLRIAPLGPPVRRCSSLWDKCTGQAIAMDTSTRKFTVRRWFSIYLKNKAARSKNSPGFCQLEVSQSTKLSRTEHPCLSIWKALHLTAAVVFLFFIFLFSLSNVRAQCVMCFRIGPESLQRRALWMQTDRNMQNTDRLIQWTAATVDFYL